MPIDRVRCLAQGRNLLEVLVSDHHFPEAFMPAIEACDRVVSNPLKAARQQFAVPVTDAYDFYIVSFL